MPEAGNLPTEAFPIPLRIDVQIKSPIGVLLFGMGFLD
jgi:hypothetical protein